MCDTKSKYSSIGSLLQLYANSAEDKHIHEDATAFLFQESYSQHTPFAINQDTIIQPQKVALGKTAIYKIPKIEDMLYKMYLSIELPEIHQKSHAIYKNKLGFLLIDKIVFKINSLNIIEYTGEYLYVKYILNHHISKNDAINKMMGIRASDFDVHYVHNPSNEYNHINGFAGEAIHEKYRQKQNLYIPIYLWDQNELLQFFPISALYNEDIELHITFKSFNKLYIVDKEESTENKLYVQFGINEHKEHVGVSVGRFDENEPVHDVNEVEIIPNVVLDAKLDIEYISLLKEERKTVIQNSQDYIFTKILTQKEKLTSNSNKIQLDFAFPIKQLIWFISHEETLNNYNQGQFIRFETARFTFSDLQNNMIMGLQNDTYFSYIQSFTHNVNIPTTSNI